MAVTALSIDDAVNARIGVSARDRRACGTIAEKPDERWKT